MASKMHDSISQHHNHHHQQQQQQQQSSRSAGASAGSRHVSSSSMTEILPSSKYVISSDSITINKELGAGEFGVVQQGVWTNEEGERIQVAIKCLSKQRMQNNSMEFLKEAAMMHSIQNEHIVRLFGVVLDSSSLMLVTELAPLRSLLECLKEPALRQSFPVISLCDFSQQIADGMLYLENKRLIHRDLAARNILVFARNRIKISDFGLSRALGVGKDYYQTNFNVNLKLPIAWCAQECINYLKFTSASDVWAFGVTLWEMFSYGFQPWAALTGQQILEAIDEPNLQRLEQPDSCPREYYSLMVKCWEHEPSHRPKFSDIVRLLPDCRPELVQVVKEWRDSPAALTNDSTGGQKKDFLVYKISDVITVLDKKPNLPVGSSGLSNGSSSHNRMSQQQFDHNLRNEETSSTTADSLWKGSLLSGKTGLFDPGNTVTYLGHTLPQSAGCPLLTSSSLSTTSNGSTAVSGGGSNSTGSSHHHHHANHFPGLTTSSFIRGILEAISTSAAGIYSSKRKLKRDMISMPQSDFKHTGHVGVDGAFFGDISFLGDKYQQIPATRNGSLTRNSSDLSDRAPLLKPPPVSSSTATTTTSSSATATTATTRPASNHVAAAGSRAYDKFAATSNCRNLNLKDLKNDHEYHEITGDDQEDCFLESPHFETLDFGPSLMDEVFRELDIKSDETEHHNSLNECSSNVKNEIRESMVSLKRKTKSCVKPISATDEQTLDSAIAMAKELASRSIMQLDGRNDNVAFECPSSADSPKTPNSPNKKTSKFSFKFKSSPKSERRTFSEEAENIPDISCDPAIISDEAKAAYDMLIEKRGVDGKRKMTPVLPPQAPANFTSSRQQLQQHNYQNQQPFIQSNLPSATLVPATVTVSNGNGHAEGHSEDDADSNPLRMLRSGVAAFSKVRGNKQRLSGSNSLRIPAATSSRSSLGAPPPIPVSQPPVHQSLPEESSSCLNPLPLPPKSATCTMKVTLKHHQRLHPLKMIPLDDGSSDSLSDENQPSPPSLSSFRPQWPVSKQISCPEPPVRNMSTLTISAPIPVTTSDDAHPRTHVTAPSVKAAGITRSDSSSSSHTPRPTVLPPPPPGPPKPARAVNEEEKSIESQVQSLVPDPVPVSVDVAQPAVSESGFPSEVRNGVHAVAEPVKSTKRKGVNSDEVRVMQKVLVNEVQLAADECVSVLNRTDWDVHRGIKCIRLRELLRQHRVAIDSMDWIDTLKKFNWNVRQASNFLIATQGSPEGSTEV